MQFTPVWIITCSLFCVVALAIIFIARFTTKPVDSYSFSFRRVFPYEVLKNNEKISTSYFILLCLFSVMCFSPLVNLMANKPMVTGIEGITIAIPCIYGLAAICFIFLHYFDATHTLPHTLLFVVFLCLTLLGNALASIKGIMIYKVFYEHNEIMLSALIGGIIAGLCSLIGIIMSINPKLRNWATLDKIESGYARPRVFILAYYEWITYFLLIIGEVSYFLIGLIQ